MSEREIEEMQAAFHRLKAAQQRFAAIQGRQNPQEVLEVAEEYCAAIDALQPDWITPEIANWRQRVGKVRDDLRQALEVTCDRTEPPVANQSQRRDTSQ